MCVRRGFRNVRYGGGVLLVPLLDCCLHSASIALGTSWLPDTAHRNFGTARVFERRIRFMENRIAVDPRRIFGRYRRGVMAKWIRPRLMRQIFAAIMFVLGALQAFSAWVALRTA